MDPVLNKNIPRKFNELGIRSFLPGHAAAHGDGRRQSGQGIPGLNHWHYGGTILEAATMWLDCPGLYRSICRPSNARPTRSCSITSRKSWMPVEALSDPADSMNTVRRGL